MRSIEETSVISPNDREILRRVKEIIRSFLPSATVLLYGSVARGTQGPESDYDILVLADELLTAADKDKIRRAILDLELSCGAVLTTMFASHQEWDSPFISVSPFHKEVERDGVIV